MHPPGWSPGKAELLRRSLVVSVLSACLIGPLVWFNLRPDAIWARERTLFSRLLRPKPPTRTFVSIPRARRVAVVAGIAAAALTPGVFAVFALLYGHYRPAQSRWSALGLSLLQGTLAVVGSILIGFAHHLVVGQMTIRWIGFPSIHMSNLEWWICQGIAAVAVVPVVWVVVRGSLPRHLFRLESAAELSVNASVGHPDVVLDLPEAPAMVGPAVAVSSAPVSCNMPGEHARGRRPWQFSLREMLIGITLIAMLIPLLKWLYFLAFMGAVVVPPVGITLLTRSNDLVSTTQREGMGERTRWVLPALLIAYAISVGIGVVWASHHWLGLPDRPASPRTISVAVIYAGSVMLRMMVSLALGVATSAAIIRAAWPGAGESEMPGGFTNAS